MGTLHLTTHFISRFQRWMAGDVSGPVYAAGEYGAGQARFFKTVDPAGQTVDGPFRYSTAVLCCCG